jgi:hypothetical protein
MKEASREDLMQSRLQEKTREASRIELKRITRKAAEKRRSVSREHGMRVDESKEIIK